MPRGRRPGPGTAEEKAAARREKVRLNVQAYRKRKHAAEKKSPPATEPSLKWVEDTKWQHEYDQHNHAERTSDAEEDSRRNSTGTSPDTQINDEDVISRDLVAVARTPAMYDTPSLGKQNSLQILSLFPERFLPDQLSLPAMLDVQTLRTPCALWVTTATRQARNQDSGALTDVLHSIVLAVMGMDQQRTDLCVEAQKLYTRSLNKTRRSLGPILSNLSKASKDDVLNLFLSCHAAAVYELLVNGSLADMLQHVKGIGLLIEHQRRLPDFPHLAGNSLVEEYRMMEIHFCLLERTLSTTFRMKSSSADPSTVSHSEAVMNTDIGLVATLLDLADQIPPIMVELDEYKQKREVPVQELMRLVQAALSLHSQLDSWSSFLHNQAFPGSPNSDSSSDSTEHIDLGQITQYEFATCYLFSLSYDLHAIEVCIEAVTALAQRTNNSSNSTPNASRPPAQQQLLRTRVLAVAGTMLELMPYFFRQDKGIIGRSIAIWPLEGVWRILDNESSRLDWDEHVAGMTDVSQDFTSKISLTRNLIERYYKLCRQSGRSARSFGLPLIREREINELVDSYLDPKRRVESIASDDIELADVYAS